MSFLKRMHVQRVQTRVLGSTEFESWLSLSYEISNISFNESQFIIQNASRGSCRN